jgi:hypothetical protein
MDTAGTSAMEMGQVLAAMCKFLGFPRLIPN